MFLQLFSIINGVNVSKPQYLSSDWLHTACQVSFIKKYCNLKISSLFGGYLWISPVNIFEQPHGSDQCGYIHLLYRFVCSFTVVEVWPLCRLGCDISTRHLRIREAIKKTLQPKYSDTSKFGLLGKPTKKTRAKSIILIHFWGMQNSKIEKSCFFSFFEKIFFWPLPH